MFIADKLVGFTMCIADKLVGFTMFIADKLVGFTMFIADKLVCRSSSMSQDETSLLICELLLRYIIFRILTINT